MSAKDNREPKPTGIIKQSNEKQPQRLIKSIDLMWN